MTRDDRLRIEAADVHSAAATLLIARLTQELAARYDDDGGMADWRPSDVQGLRGAFLIAFLDDLPAACGAFRPFTSDTAEIKRMYVEPAYRNRGLGRRILAALEEHARQAGYGKVRLETGTEQPEAMRLYEATGYYRIACYGYHKDDPRSVCFEKTL
jgi:putative acetyltransferase